MTDLEYKVLNEEDYLEIPVESRSRKYYLGRDGSVMSLSFLSDVIILREMKLQTLDFGYKYVMLGDRKTVAIHKLMAELWMRRKLGDDEFVHHKDGDRGNNHIENLVIGPRRHFNPWNPSFKPWGMREGFSAGVNKVRSRRF